MSALDRLDDSIEPDEFFREILSEIHDERADEFDRICEVPVVVSFVVTAGFDQEGTRWTVRFGSGPLEVVQGELDEPPLASVLVRADDWPLFRERLADFVEDAEEWAYDNVFEPIGDKQLGWLRDFEGRVTFKIKGYETPEGRRDLLVRLVLNSYADLSPRRVLITIDAHDAEAMRTGELSPGRAFADEKLRLRGDVALAMQLGATLQRFV